MIVDTDVDSGCVQAAGDSAVVLTEFRTWLDRERGLSPVSVRCYSKQAKYFLAAAGGPGMVSGLDAGKVTAFMVDWSRDCSTGSAKAMVTSLRAFPRFAHATGKTGVPLAGAVPAVASWRLAALPQGLKAAEIDTRPRAHPSTPPSSARSWRSRPGDASGPLSATSPPWKLTRWSRHPTGRRGTAGGTTPCCCSPSRPGCECQS